MAQTGYLFIRGAVQEEIETLLNKDGVEGGIPFYKFRHAIRVPGGDGALRRDGMPVHGVIEVVKEVDETSPKLFRALCVGETLSSVELEWYTVEDGVSKLFYSISLAQCFLVGITTEKADVRKPENENLRMYETLEFSYSAIRWNYELSDAESYFEFDTTAPIPLKYLDKGYEESSAEVKVDTGN